MIICSNIKDVAILQLTDIIEASVKRFGVFIRLAKIFSISSKAFQDIITNKGPYWSMENRRSLGAFTTRFLQAFIDSILVVLVGMHQMVILLNMLEIVFMSG